MADRKEFVEGLSALIEKYFGGSGKESEVEVVVTKSLDEEERLALFVVLEPQEESYTTDLHGDTYSAKEIEKACNDFAKHCNKANLFHKVETEHAQVVQNFVTPTDLPFEDGRIVKAGSWLQWWHFPETDEGEAIWKAVKSGEINGVSVSCRANTEDLE